MDNDVPPVTAPQFAIAERGYDRQQVDEFVTGLQQRIAELEDGKLAGERDELKSTDRDFRALGTRIGRMLELADAEAAAMRERAARDAEQIVARARREAEQVTQEEKDKRDGLQRQLRALHASLASLLDILPADVAEGAGVTPGDPPAADAHPSRRSGDASLDDLLDDSTQVVPIIRRDGQ